MIGTCRQEILLYGHSKKAKKETLGNSPEVIRKVSVFFTYDYYLNPTGIEEDLMDCYGNYGLVIRFTS